MRASAGSPAQVGVDGHQLAQRLQRVGILVALFTAADRHSAIELRHRLVPQRQPHMPRQPLREHPPRPATDERAVDPRRSIERAADTEVRRRRDRCRPSPARRGSSGGTRSRPLPSPTRCRRAASPQPRDRAPLSPALRGSGDTPAATRRRADVADRSAAVARSRCSTATAGAAARSRSCTAACSARLARIASHVLTTSTCGEHDENGRHPAASALCRRANFRSW